MHEVDAAHSGLGKAIDDVVDIDLHVAVYVQHRESIEPLLAAAGAQKRLHAAQSADTSLTSTSRNREDTTAAAVYTLVKSEVGIVNNGVKKITAFEMRRQRRNGISLV